MQTENGVNNTPQTENQVVENEALTPEVSPEVPVADPAQAPEVSVIGAADAADPVEPVINEGNVNPEEGIVNDEEGPADDISTPTKEEVDEFFGTHLDEEVKEAPLTDEDILKKVAEAACNESGDDWNGLSEEEKAAAIRAAKFFKENPEAHPDQFYHGVVKAERPDIVGFYELPEELQTKAEVFAASVKNAYKA